MKTIIQLFAIFLFASNTPLALAKDDSVKISHATARATAPGQDSAMVALHLTSRSNAQLIAVSSPIASSAEIHNMSHENGMMKMRSVEKLALPARQEVALGSDGNHLMLMGLSKALKAGDVVPLQLTVQFADQHTVKINTQAKVTPLLAQHEEHEHHHHQ